MGVEDAARRGNHIGGGETRDDLLGREVVAEHFRRIETHHVLALLAADDLDTVDARDTVEAGDEIVEGDVGEFGEIAHSRTQTQIEDREGAAGQQAGVDGGGGGKAAAGVGERAAEKLKGTGRIAIRGEGNVDFRAAPGGGGAHQTRTGDAVGGLFERARDGHHHLLARQFAAIGQDNRAREDEFGKDRARDRGREQAAEQGRPQGDEKSESFMVGVAHRYQPAPGRRARKCARPIRTLTLTLSLVRERGLMNSGKQLCKALRRRIRRGAQRVFAQGVATVAASML